MAEAKWYVVHTYSGYENKVKANIEKTIENNKSLAEQILEVRVPMQDVVELKDGARKTVSKKMFPGYVLLNMEMNDDTWYVVRNTRGVTGFVGPGSKPVPLTEAEMKPLGIKTENVSIDFGEGDSIAVVAGVWKDTVGVALFSVLPKAIPNSFCVIFLYSRIRLMRSLICIQLLLYLTIYVHYNKYTILYIKNQM